MKGQTDKYRHCKRCRGEKNRDKNNGLSSQILIHSLRQESALNRTTTV